MSGITTDLNHPWMLLDANGFIYSKGDLFLFCSASYHRCILYDYMHLNMWTNYICKSETSESLIHFFSLEKNILKHKYMAFRFFINSNGNISAIYPTKYSNK